jgi:hypothetical protein
MVLAEADPALLLPREAAILEARHLQPDLRPVLIERLGTLSWDEATGWRELEAFCEAAVGRRSTGEVNLGHARRIVAALARHGPECEGKLLDLLGRQVAADDRSAMLWMEPLVVRLAGLIRLEAAVPPIVAKLLADGGDILNEECAEALTRIGTPAVLHDLAGAYPGAGDHFRLYAIGPLANIHSDLAVETSLNLLGQEPDEPLRRQLAQALLTQFASEGIEATRRLLVGRELDFEGRGLRDYLLETCTVTGERFPEYDEWLAASRAEKEAHRKRVEELRGDPTGLLMYAVEKLTGLKAADAPRLEPRRPSIAPLSQPRRPEGRRKVGRNEPCPCGSGKKFKMCCGRR